MKQTLLEMTMDVLNTIDGDEINSISDNVESLQIANDIRNVFYDIIGRKDWQFLRKLTTLESVSDSTKPTHLKIRENIKAMDFLKYNKKKVGNDRTFYDDVSFLFPDQFLAYVNQRDNTKSNYQLVSDYDGAIITIRNDAQPTYWTSFDDIHIVMDSFNSNVEDTLKGSNTQASMYVIPDWTMDDEFIPELPSEVFPLLLSESKAYAQAKKDEVVLKKIEQTAVRQQRKLSQSQGVAQVGVRYPDYGRRSPKGGGSYNRSALFGPKD